jgi:hypothetical protein
LNRLHSIFFFVDVVVLLDLIAQFVILSLCLCELLALHVGRAKLGWWSYLCLLCFALHVLLKGFAGIIIQQLSCRVVVLLGPNGATNPALILATIASIRVLISQRVLHRNLRIIPGNDSLVLLGLLKHLVILVAPAFVESDEFVL